MQKNAEYEFPVVDNIQDPMSYKNIFSQVDVILLDNYFPSKNGREEPLGVQVLELLLDKNISIPVICISDYKERLIDRYPMREKAFNMGIVKGFPSKDTKNIQRLLKSLL